MIRLRYLLLATLTFAAWTSSAAAQQGQEWFVPGQGQQRPAQSQPAQQRPQQPAQRPQQQPPAASRAPAALPPGQPPPAAVIGIVDIPEVQRLSTAFGQLRDEIERRRTRLNDDLQREQNGWREAQQQLAAQRATLTPDQVRERERQLQERITDSQRVFRNRSQAMEAAAQQAVGQIEEALANIVRLVAQSRQVNLVLPRPLVIMNEPAFDITEEVAQQFNRQFRSVTIAPESDGSAPPAAAQPRPAAQPGTAPAAAPPAAQQPRRN
jgi:Skp family chaperone for outer membrane proteins